MTEEQVFLDIMYASWYNNLKDKRNIAITFHFP